MRDDVCDFCLVLFGKWHTPGFDREAQQALTQARLPYKEISGFWPGGSVPIINDLFEHTDWIQCIEAALSNLLLAYGRFVLLSVRGCINQRFKDFHISPFNNTTEMTEAGMNRSGAAVRFVIFRTCNLPAAINKQANKQTSKEMFKQAFSWVAWEERRSLLAASLHLQYIYKFIVFS